MRRLEGYRWSSYPGYVAKHHAQEFVCYDVLREYGATLAAARGRYRVYVHAGVMEDDEPLHCLRAKAPGRYGRAFGPHRSEQKRQPREVAPTLLLLPSQAGSIFGRPAIE